jgi:hypothetical protein
MTPEERKRAAQALNRNPLLEDIFDTSIQKCFDVWQADPNPQDRDQLWNRAKAIQLLRIEVYAAVKSALRDEQQKSIDT